MCPCPRHDSVQGGAEVWLHFFLTSVLDGVELLTACQGRLILVGCCVGPKAGLDDFGEDN
jgi:hypothetical protein